MDAVVGFISDVQLYVVPAIFAIGIIFLLYGFVNSFWLDRPDLGHPSLLRAVLFFSSALIVYGILAGLLWLVDVYEDVTPPSRTESGRPGANVGSDRNVLPVPNAPGSND